MQRTFAPCTTFVVASLLLLTSTISWSNEKLDSLKDGLHSTVDRTERFKFQYEIGRYYLHSYQWDSAVVAFEKSLNIAPKSDFEMQGRALLAIANAHHHNEDVTLARPYYKMAIKAHEKAGSGPEVLADCYMHYGRAFYEKSEYDSAMTHYMTAKAIFEDNKIENENYGYLMHYIGSVYKRQDNMDKACEYYELEMEYGLEHDFDYVYAEALYLSVDCLTDVRERLKRNKEALKIYQKLRNTRMMGLLYGNMALTYQEAGMLDSALFWQRISLGSKRREGNPGTVSQGLSDLGMLLIEMHHYQEAEKYLIEAEALALQTDLKRHLRLESAYKGLYSVNYNLKKFRKAVDYLNLYHAYKDSARALNHQEVIDQMRIAHQEAEIKMLEKDNLLKVQQAEMAEADAAAEATEKLFYLFGGVILLILGVFAFIKLKESQKQKRVIEDQKIIVEEKNKDITDSIVYASSIQSAIINTQDNIAEMFDESFVFYLPRDIVSGDFYWAHTTDDGMKIVVVGDCTGHGVPGAMMSMLGSAFLNEIIIEGKERSPNVILDKMREQVKRAMVKKQASDGMDMSVCCFDGSRLSFAGANLPLYLLRNGDIEIVKGCKQPVGSTIAEKPFESKEIDVSRGDQFYLFSDGFADQFGGPKGKKYKYQTLRQKLLDFCKLPLQEQGVKLQAEFEEWKGDFEQVDDVCLIGFRV